MTCVIFSSIPTLYSCFFLVYFACSTYYVLYEIEFVEEANELGKAQLAATSNYTKEQKRNENGIRTFRFSFFLLYNDLDFCQFKVFYT